MPQNCKQYLFDWPHSACSYLPDGFVECTIYNARLSNDVITKNNNQLKIKKSEYFRIPPAPDFRQRIALFF